MNNTKTKFIFSFVLFIFITSCFYPFGGELISKPDEYTRVYDVKEKIILRTIASIIKEKNMGTHVLIDDKNHLVDSDYVISGKWRTKTKAHVRQINWKECEVILSISTEKKTEKGWEMRRLLQKDQYDTFFSEIDFKVYEEMSKIE
jgi:hypothetical protein